MSTETSIRRAGTDAASVSSSRVVAVALAALLGTMLVAGTGFAHSEAVHNAAHDTRHSLAFPCH
jgi:cobalt transporter subunit CbtB